jgi:hypothetical protein
MLQRSFPRLPPLFFQVNTLCEVIKGFYTLAVVLFVIVGNRLRLSSDLSSTSNRSGRDLLATPASSPRTCYPVWVVGPVPVQSGGVLAVHM